MTTGKRFETDYILLEKYYTGKLSRKELLFEFLSNLSKEVKGERPKPTTVEKYVSGTSDYFRTFKDYEMNTLAVEKEFNFSIGDNQFIGYIDYLGEREGEIYLIDNKSRDLRPRSSKAKPTLNDKQIDDMLRQLYLYSAAVKEEYGRFPSYLCFNCFRAGVFIKL